MVAGKKACLEGLLCVSALGPGCVRHVLKDLKSFDGNAPVETRTKENPFLPPPRIIDLSPSSHASALTQN